MPLTSSGREALFAAAKIGVETTTPQDEAAKAMRSMFESWIRAGFTEDQALKLLSNVLTSGTPPTPSMVANVVHHVESVF
jgi:hypothetical protein